MNPGRTEPWGTAGKSPAEQDCCLQEVTEGVSGDVWEVSWERLLTRRVVTRIGKPDDQGAGQCGGSHPHYCNVDAGFPHQRRQPFCGSVAAPSDTTPQRNNNDKVERQNGKAQPAAAMDLLNFSGVSRHSRMVSPAG
jgi:hypothetical protein